MYTTEICGHCKYRMFYSGDWLCTNPDSDMCGLEVEYKDHCFDFEEKE